MRFVTEKDKQKINEAVDRSDYPDKYEIIATYEAGSKNFFEIIKTSDGTFEQFEGGKYGGSNCTGSYKKLDDCAMFLMSFFNSFPGARFTGGKNAKISVCAHFGDSTGLWFYPGTDPRVSAWMAKKDGRTKIFDVVLDRNLPTWAKKTIADAKGKKVFDEKRMRETQNLPAIAQVAGVLANPKITSVVRQDTIFNTIQEMGLPVKINAMKNVVAEVPDMPTAGTVLQKIYQMFGVKGSFMVTWEGKGKLYFDPKTPVDKPIALAYAKQAKLPPPNFTRLLNSVSSKKIEEGKTVKISVSEFMESLSELMDQKVVAFKQYCHTNTKESDSCVYANFFVAKVDMGKKVFNISDGRNYCAIHLDNVDNVIIDQRSVGIIFNNLSFVDLALKSSQLFKYFV